MRSNQIGLPLSSVSVVFTIARRMPPMRPVKYWLPFALVRSYNFAAVKLGACFSDMIGPPFRQPLIEGGQDWQRKPI